MMKINLNLKRMFLAFFFAGLTQACYGEVIKVYNWLDKDIELLEILPTHENVLGTISPSKNSSYEVDNTTKLCVRFVDDKKEIPVHLHNTLDDSGDVHWTLKDVTSRVAAVWGYKLFVNPTGPIFD